MKTQIVLLSLVACTFGAKINNPGWKIIGGAAAAPAQFPHQISFRARGSHSCGGSIIDETTILTAAHCVHGRDPSRMTVMVGSNQLSKGGIVYKIASYVHHDDYNAIDKTNDICIIKLESPLQYNDRIKPVEIRQEDITGNQTAIFSGWGATVPWGEYTEDLQWITLRTLSVEDCAAQQPTSTPSEVCTLTKSGEGACHRDTGGGLLDDKGRLFGIYSWGDPCALGKPDVFTRVSSFLDWIEENR